MGLFHNVSEAHLYRYLAEFDFRHNNRHLGDEAMGKKLLADGCGKRLAYSTTS